jgi:CheY-like chemotaxis protein
MQMPLFNYPSTVVWVDDSEIFIKSIQKNSQEFNPNFIKTFECPLECLKFFANYKPANLEESFLLSCKNYEESDLVDHAPTDINFEKICLAFEGDKIKEEVSVIIVDQNMPGMNGIDLCKQLSHLPIKKILLTGAITEDEVISAFNNRIIDCYIRKNSDKVIDDIKIHVKLLTEKYFSERSSALLSHLEADKKLHFSDPAFISFFAEWCKKNNIIKYFFFDKLGNMRVIDDKNKVSNFIIYNNDTLNEFIHLNNLTDEPNEFIQVISSKHKLPFFGERKNGWEIASNEWAKYLYPCSIANGRIEYYWCVVDSQQKHGLLQNE